MPPERFAPGLSRGAARQVLATALEAAGRPNADLDARVLLCGACGVDHAGLIRDPDIALGTAAAVLDGYLERRLADEPVSRILGRREFWGLEFKVTPDVLDPRPDTESVVDSALDALGGRRAAPLRVLDLGTGSGAILCALLEELPSAFGVGIDRSAPACRVASANVRALGFASRAAIVRADFAEPIAARFDVVASNPPYIRTGTLGTLERAVRDHDPAMALDGGVDGLEAYRAIVPRLHALLRPGGVAVLECGFDGAAPVAAMMRDGGLAQTSVRRDLAGHARVVVATTT